MTRNQLTWVLINKAAQETGYTPAAIRTKTRRGIWVQGRHWVKGPDNRVHINLPAIQAWVTEGRQ